MSLVALMRIHHRDDYDRYGSQEGPHEEPDFSPEAPASLLDIA